MQFNANIYEIHWLEENDLTDKLAVVRKRAKERIAYLQAENKRLDVIYYGGLSLHEPLKYQRLQAYLDYGK